MRLRWRYKTIGNNTRAHLVREAVTDNVSKRCLAYSPLSIKYGVLPLLAQDPEQRGEYPSNFGQTLEFLRLIHLGHVRILSTIEDILSSRIRQLIHATLLHLA